MILLKQCRSVSGFARCSLMIATANLGIKFSPSVAMLVLEHGYGLGSGPPQRQSGGPPPRYNGAHGPNRV